MGAGWDIGIGELPPGLIGMKAYGGKETCGEPDGDGVINEWFICGQFGMVLTYTSSMQCHLGSPLGRQTSMSYLS